MRKGFALALLSISWLFASAANGATISFLDTYGPETIPLPATDLATLSQFVPALGTLTKVTLALDADTSAGTRPRTREPGRLTLSCVKESFEIRSGGQ